MVSSGLHRLGSITCPSGQLVIVDTGYLGLWSGEGSPEADEAVLDGFDDPAMRESIRGAADLVVVGAGAEAAARSFDRQAGTWIYDIPGHGIEQLTASFDEHCRTRGWDARLERQEPRVSHRERVRRSVRAGGQEFVMHGVPVVAVGGLPAGEEFAVVANAEDFGGGYRWESVSVAVRPGASVGSRLLGHVGVDAARLSFADADALSAWKHEEPVDGLADVAFWGRSMDEAAVSFGASALPNPGEEGVYGWVNLPVEDAVDRAIAVEKWKRAVPGRGLAVDFRPHSHHWQVMKQVRASELEAGTITVGGARTMCFMTSWGDGFFPVHAEHDAEGNLVRIRIVLGDPERQARLEAMYDRMR